MDHAIKNKRSIFFYKDQQHLIYVKGERDIRKRRIVKAIKMKFILLGRSKKLAIFAPTILTANGVGGSTVHTTLGVNNRVKKNNQVKNSAQ